MQNEIKRRQILQSAERPELDFSKIKIGVKTVEDAIYNLGDLKKVNPRLGDKKEVLRAINNGDLKAMREISNFFFKTSGIYARLCRYMAYLYRYDWVITPYVNDTNIKKEKILDSFNKALFALDNFDVKAFCNDVALKVVKNGCFYGYLIPTADRMTVQELPSDYCRSQFKTASGAPVVEFHMKFFDDYFRDTNQKMRMLKLFPKEFAKGYILYKEGKLPPQFSGDTSGWFTLDPEFSVKFNLNGEDYPPFISVIPAILDLDSALELDRKKMQQQLLKIIVQQMPIDKNGDLVFDVDEAAELHNNAVHMLGKAIGLDVLTTFADVSVETLTDNSAIDASNDSIENAKQAVFDMAGVSQMQFNTDGNIALDKSILNDEAMMYNLVIQFKDFLNRIIKPFNKTPKKMFIRAEMLPTTIYNYKEMAKLYKEHTQLGYSKMLPQIALGQSQSSILATAHFENEVLDLINVFIPPITSNTMNGDMLKKDDPNSKNPNSKEAGRPTKESQGESVTEKTIQNQEAKS